jgi:hypothetical protein
VWIDDDGITQYHLPEELECLREAEKLLIAQVSAYVPLHHLRKGQLGCRGHTCCFTQVRQILSFMTHGMMWLTLFLYHQDINEVCTRLPRTPENAKLIRVIRKFRLGTNEIGVKAFSVRREVVLKALRWLKQYNVLYKEIEIVEENLKNHQNRRQLPPMI